VTHCIPTPSCTLQTYASSAHCPLRVHQPSPQGVTHTSQATVCNPPQLPGPQAQAPILLACGCVVCHRMPITGMMPAQFLAPSTRVGNSQAVTSPTHEPRLRPSKDSTPCRPLPATLPCQRKTRPQGPGDRCMHVVHENKPPLDWAQQLLAPTACLQQCQKAPTCKHSY
jgi:hypothetical protein